MTDHIGVCPRCGGRWRTSNVEGITPVCIFCWQNRNQVVPLEKVVPR